MLLPSTQHMLLIRFNHVRPFGIVPDSLQAPLSMGFSSQEYWNELLCPPSGDLPSPGIEPVSLKSPALVGRFFTISATWEAQQCCITSKYTK